MSSIPSSTAPNQITSSSGITLPQVATKTQKSAEGKIPGSRHCIKGQPPYARPLNCPTISRSLKKLIKSIPSGTAGHPGSFVPPTDRVIAELAKITLSPPPKKSDVEKDKK